MKLWADGLHDSLRRGLSLDFALSLEEGTAQNSGPDNLKRLAIMGNELADTDVQGPAAAMEIFYNRFSVSRSVNLKRKRLSMNSRSGGSRY